MPTIKFHQDLRVYQKSFDTAMEIYKLSKIFPAEERDSLTDQIRRSSRSVSANISGVWGKRKYENLLFQNLQILKARQEKLRPGCNLQEVVSILMKNNLKF
ncbi:four helix bundle protein [Chryseobacterium nepalense]|uniref:four helix bundle protein n=1 Tax=Chryseobacterium nepalense TaxID=1854498 RepID=UPI003D12ED65